MAIQIHGIYEYDVGNTVYRIYIIRKKRDFYVSIINQSGTGLLYLDDVSEKFLKDVCKYIGPARNTWEDLFQTY